MSEGPKVNYYEVLEINENTTNDDIRRAYRKLALKWHPDKNENKKEAEEKFKLINEAYAVLSDPTKRKEYDDYRRFGSREGTRFEFTNFRRNFDPFEEFQRFFEGNSFGFDNDDNSDIFSHNNIFRRFKGFGGGFDRGFGKGFQDFDDMGGFGDFRGGSGFQFSSSTAGGMGTAASKSVKKTTQIINGQKVSKIETTTIDKNGIKKIEVTEEFDDGRGNKSTNTRQQLQTESSGKNTISKKEVR